MQSIVGGHNGSLFIQDMVCRSPASMLVTSMATSSWTLTTAGAPTLLFTSSLSPMRFVYFLNIKTFPVIVALLLILCRHTSCCQCSTRPQRSTTRLPSPLPTGQTPPSPWPPPAATGRRPAQQSRRHPLDDNRPINQVSRYSLQRIFSLSLLRLFVFAAN